MKFRNPRSLLLGLLGLFTLPLVPVQAQLAPGGTPMPGLDAALLKIMGTDASFTATSTMEMSGGGQNVKIRMKLSVRDGMTRSELDMANIEGAAIPPMAMAQMKRLGMDRITTLLIGGGRTNVIIYPGLKAYVQTANPGSGACTISEKSRKNEEVDGVTLVRRDIAVDCDGMATQSFTVWAKADGAIPSRLQTEQSGMKVDIRLTDVKMDEPDADLFKKPDSYQGFESMGAFMGHIQQKIIQQQSAQ